MYILIRYARINCSCPYMCQLNSMALTHIGTEKIKSVKSIIMSRKQKYRSNSHMDGSGERILPIHKSVSSIIALNHSITAKYYRD